MLRTIHSLAAERGEIDWPHNVYRLYWPLARSDGFSIGRSDSRRRQQIVAS